MKKTISKSIFILLFIPLIISSCDTDENNIGENSIESVNFKKLNYDVSLLFESELPKGRLDDGIIYITEEGAIQTLSQYLDGCVQNLRDRGFSDDEIIGEFGSLQNPAIITSIDWLNKIERTVSNMNNVQAKEDPDIYDCLLRAVGIDAVVELFNGKVTKAIAKKAIRKIVSRATGWVGAAIAIYEFSDCMGAFD